MKKLKFLIITILFLFSYPPKSQALAFKESLKIKGEVAIVYEVPQKNESIPIPELRKPYFAKIRIIETLAPTKGDSRKDTLVPIHKMAYNEPLSEGQIFIGKLHYDCSEHRRYSYMTCEVTLEIEEFINPAKLENK